MRPRGCWTLDHGGLRGLYAEVQWLGLVTGHHPAPDDCTAQTDTAGQRTSPRLRALK